MKPLRSLSLQIFKAALAKVDAYRAVKKTLSLEGHSFRVRDGSSFRNFDLRSFKNIFILGAGKAAVPMAAACEAILKDKLHGGLIITKYGHAGHLTKVKCIEAGHPLPDQKGVMSSRQIVSMLEAAQPDDLILFLTSGGCSALFTAPAASISPREKQKTTQLLLKAGASIQELNIVRKHLSSVKGGRSARLAFPSTVINLVLSDVIGNHLDIIGSGPFAPDPSSFQDAWNILEKYNLLKKVPFSIAAFIAEGVQGLTEETPKPGTSYFYKVTQAIIATNLMALKAASKEARSFGFKTFILSTQVQGEARELAKFYGAVAREIFQSGNPSKKPVCLLAGGEPTVTVSGNGLGGRNTELALAVALEIKGMPGTLFLSAGTDGTDGPTDAAGAIISGFTYTRALKKGVSPEGHLSDNDSYTFFKKAGGLLMTGPTGTNVMDLHILLVR